MEHKICNLIQVFGIGAIKLEESCKCLQHLLSFMTNPHSKWSHWTEVVVFFHISPGFRPKPPLSDKSYLRRIKFAGVLHCLGQCLLCSRCTLL